MNKVYCKDCEHMTGRGTTAEYNCALIKVTYSDTWYGPSLDRVQDMTIYEKNKYNDCKDFKQWGPRL